MNLLKSFFILLAPLWLFYICVFGIYGLVASEYKIKFFGVLLSALPLLTFLSMLLVLKKWARTSRHMIYLTIPSFLGYGLVLLLFLQNRNIHYTLSVLLSMSAFLLTFLYVYWYSSNSRKKQLILKINNKLPCFDLVAVDGKKISSDSFIGKKSVIFFYRGNWCPLCMAQIDEVAKDYKKFEKLGVATIFISPQPQSHTKKLAEKFDLSFQFYVDENNQAAKQLGLLHHLGLPMGFQLLGYDSDSVYPTILAIDEQGIIIYSDQTSNYRVRPEPDEILKEFTKNNY
jgi:peroxiredoxin